MTPFLFAVSFFGAASLQMTIDPQRLDSEIAADADVLRSLAENGDMPNVVRPVVAYFYGSPEAIGRLEQNLDALGWRLVHRMPLEDGTAGIAASRDQTTEPAAIRQFSEAALGIEVEYGVVYDGWETRVEQR